MTDAPAASHMTAAPACELRSAATVSASPLRLPAALASLASSRPAIATRAPADERARAAARPIPLLLPVTTAAGPSALTHDSPRHHRPSEASLAMLTRPVRQVRDQGAGITAQDLDHDQAGILRP